MADPVTEPHAGTLAFVSRSAPYGTDNAAACLELVLACAVFDQDVRLIFLGDGLYQLLKKQDGGRIDAKDLAGVVRALELYGVGQLFVSGPDMVERCLAEADLVVPVVVLGDDEISGLLDAARMVFTL